MNLQEHFIRKALTEKCIKFSRIDCDHRNAVSYVDFKKYPLIFPMSLFEVCQVLKSEKTTEYYFRGVITPQRKWMYGFKNATIINSFRGRNGNKFTYDSNYYIGLSRAKFALCPVGDCNWSYRLFEAVMCGCIPVIEEHDIFHNVFFHYHKDDQHIYLPEKAKENLKILESNYLL